MKRILALLFIACMVFSLSACNTSDDNTSSRRQNADSQIESFDIDITEAVDAITEKWKELYQEKNNTDGYFEIKNTRVIFIKENTDVAEFQDIRYIVEFDIYSDYFATAPYYLNPSIDDSVSIHKDGTLTVNHVRPILSYRSRTYSNDYSNIIESITDLGDQFNMTKNFK